MNYLTTFLVLRSNTCSPIIQALRASCEKYSFGRLFHFENCQNKAVQSSWVDIFKVILGILSIQVVGTLSRISTVRDDTNLLTSTTSFYNVLIIYRALVISFEAPFDTRTFQSDLGYYFGLYYSKCRCRNHK